MSGWVRYRARARVGGSKSAFPRGRGYTARMCACTCARINQRACARVYSTASACLFTISRGRAPRKPCAWAFSDGGKWRGEVNLVRCGLTPLAPYLPPSRLELPCLMVCVFVHVGTVERCSFGPDCLVYFSRDSACGGILAFLNVQCL